MESVSLSVPPEDPADIYIPTIHADQEQSPSPCSSSAEQAVQLPTIRYTPSSGTVPPPLVAAGTRTAIVAAADPTTPAFFQYRTTTFTQVHFAAAQAFSYPPTPPLDGPCGGEPDRSQDHLAITQGPAGLDYPDNNPAAAGSINPFPSLPTPPDMEAMHHQQSSSHGPPPLASDAESNHSPITTTSPHMLKQNAVMDVNAASSPWQGQHASNICFVPPAPSSVSPQMFQFNARRNSPSFQPAIYYPATAVSMQQPMSQLHNGGPRGVPPLVKGLDGE